MAISGPWIGSQAVTETGKRWAQEQFLAVRLPAAGWYSSLNGRSREVTIYINTANHNYNYVDLQNALYAQGTTPVRIEVTQHLASYSTLVPCFNFPADLQNEYITLYITSNVMGRGGDGATAGSRYGKPGGGAISNWIGGRLRIDNRGAICGGGGGGEGRSLNSNLSTAGSGGRPLGLGGTGEGRDSVNGNNASYDSPGASARNSRYDQNGGAGGEVGSNGGNSSGNGSGEGVGAAGMAVAGTTPTWINRGNIYGATV